ncbi:hypothetical protein KI387_003663, partial [Taxus chinensis]
NEAMFGETSSSIYDRVVAGLMMVTAFWKEQLQTFFAVCYQETKEKDEEDLDEKSASRKWIGYEVHTAPVIDGVLPGVIRQLVIEICADEGIPLQEAAPSWSNRQLWKEAFITNSVRLVQHVESIQAPSSWIEFSHAKSWKEVSWKALHLQGPGLVTQEIQLKYVNLKSQAKVFQVRLETAKNNLSVTMKMKENIVLVNKQNNTLKRIIKENGFDPDILFKVKVATNSSLVSHGDVTKEEQTIAHNLNSVAEDLISSGIIQAKNT